MQYPGPLAAIADDSTAGALDHVEQPEARRAKFVWFAPKAVDAPSSGHSE
jgi:hypothetical protein